GFGALTDPNTRQTKNIGRFEINNFQMAKHEARNTSQQGIFLKAARFNHSCVPNAYFNWNPALHNLTIYAIHGIEVGNEILVNYEYQNAYERREDRRQSLQDSYLFWCSCVACKDGPNLDQNEALRATMRDLDARIQAGAADAPTQRQNIRRLLGLLDAAGITYPQNAELYGQLAESWKGLMQQIDPREIQYRNECRMAAENAACSRLDAEIVAVGDDSTEVRDTLRLIGSLRP
ncbi:MAG: hypothetical protein Q9224_004678, partial [Gallowayella concinna]